MKPEVAALANAIHRTLCDSQGVTKTVEHPFDYEDAEAIIADLLRWQVHVVHVEDYRGLTMEELAA